MNKVLVFKSQDDKDPRVPLLPEEARKLCQLGCKVWVAAGLGSSLGISNEDYEAEGCDITSAPTEVLDEIDIVLSLGPPSPDMAAAYKAHHVHIGSLNAFQNGDQVREWQDRGFTTIALDFIPRTTIAQKMDVLSSQANLVGYSAVIVACYNLNKLAPMMMTPSGTIQPARFFILGAGVAGLQAIATARRLGARVDAYDPRPDVEEQVKSLGARFIQIKLGETGQTKDGYAKALKSDQIREQQIAMAEYCASSDVVITTAQVFGKKAPKLITREMIERMPHGSVIVDGAVESGGNVEGSIADGLVKVHGVTIIGYRNLACRVAHDASQMHSNNLVNFLSHFWVPDSQAFAFNPADEIIQASMVTHQGNIVSHRLNLH
ncbi:NAD(P) transhydrogenase subunit alpha [Pseudobacteriovorax antillogorgiicola]|uniref:proton-translocating NAD(P)(+) transhydrogenase n=1 Tax=Pseudobacteriovorax antillogorgiicola TaxID=1513793 RepID=A0A1Y6CCH3_9BACT|nr:NAD(P) transhydrogenase subunit alpha [Pseudobacteriovorax antillogorgiicola]TCS48297.1 NAD(P) transhydrogenase subunit alpha [Pseudobacteriovorax antillogorgiicola]SMF56827.1 NAD(P) transhydrogenase subunit alpha [Pseudobacteriovorax antillogorgiicola]